MLLYTVAGTLCFVEDSSCSRSWATTREAGCKLPRVGSAPTREKSVGNNLHPNRTCIAHFFFFFCWTRIMDLRSISQGPFPCLLTESTCAVALSLNSSGQAKGSNSRNNSRLNATLRLEITRSLHRASEIASRVLRCPSAHHTVGSVNSKTHTWEPTEL